MDYFSEKTSRILALYLLLKNSGGITKKNIIGQLHISARSMERAKDTLFIDFGIQTKITSHYRYVIDYHDTSEEKIKEVEEIISLVGTTKFQLKADKDSLYIEKEGTTIGLGNKYLDEINDAIVRHKNIEFEYQSFWSTKSEVVALSPVLLKQHNQRWYVVGKSKNKMYSLDRINYLKTFNLEIFEFFGSKKGIFDGVIGISQPELPKEKITLLFNSRQGRYIKSLPLHHSQIIISDNENGFKIKLNVGVNWELKEEIKKHGSLVKVLEPAHLVDEIKADLSKTLEQYK